MSWNGVPGSRDWRLLPSAGPDDFPGTDYPDPSEVSNGPYTARPRDSEIGRYSGSTVADQSIPRQDQLVTSARWALAAWHYDRDHGADTPEIRRRVMANMGDILP